MTVQFWLSLVMGAVGITGLFIAGRGRWQGWLIGLLVQPVWVAFFVITEAWGGLLLPVGYGWVYAKNLLDWRRTGGQVHATAKVMAKIARMEEAYRDLAWAEGGRFIAIMGVHRVLGRALNLEPVTQSQDPRVKVYPQFFLVSGKRVGPEDQYGVIEMATEAARRLRRLEMEIMGLTKHGHGEVLKEDEDLAKSAKTEDEKDVLEALAEENAQADQ